MLSSSYDDLDSNVEEKFPDLLPALIAACARSHREYKEGGDGLRLHVSGRAKHAKIYPQNDSLARSLSSPNSLAPISPWARAIALFPRFEVPVAATAAAVGLPENLRSISFSRLDGTGTVITLDGRALAGCRNGLDLLCRAAKAAEIDDERALQKEPIGATSIFDLTRLSRENLLLLLEGSKTSVFRIQGMARRHGGFRNIDVPFADFVERSVTNIANGQEEASVQWFLR